MSQFSLFFSMTLYICRWFSQLCLKLNTIHEACIMGMGHLLVAWCDKVCLIFVAQVVTAKSSEVNVLVVAANPEAEDVAEHAVPEQFISTFERGKLVTVAASHGGG
eukprot:GHUV01036191.1.p2 GENE.GHUV01036191.1~~GHUV01036191.1.p2  ORF type:complete len:106 (-),score=21.15 GHUV01036191.1:129-446(-)